MSDDANSKPSLRTRMVQAGHYVDEVTGAITPAIQPSTTFARDGSNELLGQYRYARESSPTVALAERLINDLEDGFETLLFGSGMAAATAIIETLATGQHIALPGVMYHAVKKWVLRMQEQRGITADFYDASQPESFKLALHKGKTAILWVETPVNPTWEVVDIAAAAKAAHAAGAILVVDSTCAPPPLTQAVELGADFVFHSATKYLNGHSDVLAGSLTAARDSALWQQVKYLQVALGATLGSHAAYLLIRGLRTLHLRVERACHNAAEFARHFEHHPRLQAVLYPGLASHPGHTVARRQMRGGFGAMLSVLVKGTEAETRAITSRLRVFVIATSLGGVESLAEHRKAVEGPQSLVPANLIRFSIGIEDVSDLIADFEQALTL